MLKRYFLNTRPEFSSTLLRKSMRANKPLPSVRVAAVNLRLEDWGAGGLFKLVPIKQEEK